MEMTIKKMIILTDADLDGYCFLEYVWYLLIIRRYPPVGEARDIVTRSSVRPSVCVYVTD